MLFSVGRSVRLNDRDVRTLTRDTGIDRRTDVSLHWSVRKQQCRCRLRRSHVVRHAADGRPSEAAQNKSSPAKKDRRRLALDFAPRKSSDEPGRYCRYRDRHLAGALAGPARLLLKAAADWRWMEDWSHSPWYPSIRLLGNGGRVTGVRRSPISRWSLHNWPVSGIAMSGADRAGDGVIHTGLQRE